MLQQQVHSLQIQVDQQSQASDAQPALSLALNITSASDKEHGADSDQLDSLQAHISDLTAHNSEIEQQRSTMEGQVQELQTQVQQLSASNSELAESRSAAKQHATSLEEQLSHASVGNSELAELHSTAEQRVASLEEQLSEVSASYSELKYGSPSVEKRVRVLQRQVTDLTESNAGAHDQINSLQDQLEVIITNNSLQAFLLIILARYQTGVPLPSNLQLEVQPHATAFTVCQSLVQCR